MTTLTKDIKDWLDSCEIRFKNMYDANLDKNGWPAIQKALGNFKKRGYFTVGEIQYLFNRSSKYGEYPDYNTRKGLHKKFGNMLPCPLKEIVDSKIVRWRGATGIIQPSFANAIRAETDWEYKFGDLIPKDKQITTKTTNAFNELFDNDNFTAWEDEELQESADVKPQPVEDSAREYQRQQIKELEELGIPKDSKGKWLIKDLINDPATVCQPTDNIHEIKAKLKLRGLLNVADMMNKGIIK